MLSFRREKHPLSRHRKLATNPPKRTHVNFSKKSQMKCKTNRCPHQPHAHELGGWIRWQYVCRKRVYISKMLCMRDKKRKKKGKGKNLKSCDQIRHYSWGYNSPSVNCSTYPDCWGCILLEACPMRAWFRFQSHYIGDS